MRRKYYLPNMPYLLLRATCSRVLRWSDNLQHRLWVWRLMRRSKRLQGTDDVRAIQQLLCDFFLPLSGLMTTEGEPVDESLLDDDQRFMSQTVAKHGFKVTFLTSRWKRGWLFAWRGEKA